MKLTDQQKLFLVNFAEAHGRQWKAELSRQWQAAEGCEISIGIRNGCGPSWLKNYPPHLLQLAKQRVEAKAKREATLVIVGCGKSKLDEPAAAEKLYTGELFKKSSTYASLIASRWLIASSKFGLLEPSQTVEPYDYSIIGKSSGERAAFRFKAQAEFACLLNEDPDNWPERIVILAGKVYVDQLRETAMRKFEIVEPLKGLGIGQRLAFLKKEIETIKGQAV